MRIGEEVLLAQRMGLAADITAAEAQMRVVGMRGRGRPGTVRRRRGDASRGRVRIGVFRGGGVVGAAAEQFGAVDCG
jgi:hypothetical protein